MKLEEDKPAVEKPVQPPRPKQDVRAAKPQHTKAHSKKPEPAKKQPEPKKTVVFNTAMADALAKLRRVPS